LSVVPKLNLAQETRNQKNIYKKQKLKQTIASCHLIYFSLVIDVYTRLRLIVCRA